jgi:mRNA interferase RelE/StbE
MSHWTLVVSKAFAKSARTIDKPSLERIREYLDEVAALTDPRTRGQALSHNRGGYWRYRVGDYRVIVEFRDTELLLIAVDVGHRSTIYRE